jgi:hypothetical protein
MTLGPVWRGRAMCGTLFLSGTMSGQLGALAQLGERRLCKA